MNRFKNAMKEVLFFAVLMALTIVISRLLANLYEWAF